MKLSQRITIIIAIIVVALLSVTGMILISSEYNSSAQSEQPVNEIVANEEVFKGDTIIVHVKGAVNNPGVYEISGNQRLNDAVNAANGLCENADAYKLNLAMKINDGDEINIPYINEDNPKGICITSDESRTNVIKAPDGQSEKGKVNINTASKEQLMTLSGIGDKISDEIINYREKNKFNTVDDLKNVNKIGNSMFEKIKDNICVK